MIEPDFLSLGLSENVFIILLLTTILQKVHMWENFSPSIMNQNDLNQ